MKLDSTIQGQLILTLPQWGFRLRGLMLMAISFLIMINMDVHYRIECQQKKMGMAHECVLKTQLYGHQLSTRSLHSLLGAVVQKAGVDTESGATLYTTRLKTTSGLISLAEGESSRFEDNEKIATAINDYVENSGALTLKVPESKSFQHFMQIIFGVIFLIGLMIFLGTNQVKVVLDSQLKTVTIHYQSLFSSKSRTYQWTDILKFDVQEKLFNFRYQATLYRILIRFSNFEVQPLTRIYSRSIKDMRDIVAEMNRFMAHTG